MPRCGTRASSPWRAAAEIEKKARPRRFAAARDRGDLRRRRRVVLRGHEDALARRELGLEGRELVLDRRDRLLGVGVGVVRVERRGVHEVDEEARPLDVLEEPDPEAVPLVRALDEAGHVRRDERPEALPRDDAEVRDERRERVVGDLRAGGRDRGDEGRLARVRQADEGHVREELQLEGELELDALAARVGAPRRAVRGRREAGVSLPALSARGHEERLALLDEVAEDLARVADPRTTVPTGTETGRSAPFFPWRLLPFPWPPRPAAKRLWKRNG